MRSGHADEVYAVRNPAAIMATFATASLRADKNAARVKLPLCDRKRARMNAHDKLMINAPAPVTDSGIGAGGSGAMNFCHAVHSVEAPGTSKIPATAIPRRARLLALQPSATAIKKLTDVSSKKSMLSAKSDTEPIATATANSTPK